MVDFQCHTIDLLYSDVCLRLKVRRRTKAASLLCSLSMTYTSSLGCVCTAQISVALQKYQCCQITCPLQRHYCPRVKPKSHTSPAALQKSLPLRHGAVYQSREGGRQGIILPAPTAQNSKSNISNNGSSRWKSGKVVRGPARRSSSSSSTRATLDPKTRTGDSRITQDHNLYFTTDIHLIPGSGF